MFVCLCTGVTSHVVSECRLQGRLDIEGSGGRVRGRFRLRTVQAHRAVDHRGALREQRRPVGGQPLVQQLPDSFDAEPDEVHIVGQQAVLAEL